MEQNTLINSQVQNNAHSENSKLFEAQKQYSEGNYREALNLLLSSDISDAEKFLDIGNCYYMLDNPKEALDYWNKVISIDPQNHKAYSNMGNLYYKLKQQDKAIFFWITASMIRPEDAQTCLNLAVAFSAKEMRFESIKYYEKYLKYSENTESKEYLQIKQKIQNCQSTAEQYLVLGVQCQNDNDNEKAAACYFKSLANYPNFSKTNMNLGSIFFSDKNLELAAKYWKAATHMDPNNAKLHSNLAITYDLMKQFSYAYCYYYRYMNLIINDKDEYYKANSRVLKIKPYLNNHQDLIEEHLSKANEHLAKNEFFDAIDEFKNYSILKPEVKKTYADIIKKIETYLNPEKQIIPGCFEIGTRLMEEHRYSEAKQYFWRIMKLSSPQYLEFSKAKAKYTSCEKAE